MSETNREKAKKVFKGKPSSEWKQDSRPAKGLYAPGMYLSHCKECGDYFIGDKRSILCADCAYGEKEIK